MSISSYSIEYKLSALQTWLEGKHTLRETAKLFRVGTTSLKIWKYRWERYGIDGLERVTTFKKYTKEEKLTMVYEVLGGKASINEVVRKYELSSTAVLRRWIQRYTCHREIKGTPKGRAPSMTKRKTTTQEERLTIVLACLSKGKDYRSIAEHYEVSYQQVYQWVKKYEKGGETGLVDRRGRTKQAEDLSAEEKAKLDLMKLERENERLRAEIAFLKKLKEIERRG